MESDRDSLAALRTSTQIDVKHLFSLRLTFSGITLEDLHIEVLD